MINNHASAYPAHTQKRTASKQTQNILKIVDGMGNVFSIWKKKKKERNRQVIAASFQRVKHFWLALGHASHSECLSLKTHFIEPHLASCMLMKVFLLIASDLGYKTIGLETDID